MSNVNQKKEEVAVQVEEESLLEKVVMATKQTERSEAETLLKALVDEALAGTVVWDKNLTHTIDMAVKKIDQLVSSQVIAIIRDNSFQKLEGSWRGLHYLVKNTLCSNDLQIKVLDVTKKMLAKNLDKAIEFDQSDLFKMIYEAEYGTPGGNPLSALIGDYEINNIPADINFMRNISGIASTAFCPFIASAGSQMFGLESWEELPKLRDLNNLFSSSEYAKWRGFRDTADSRFVTLVLPRSLARLPYGQDTNPVEGFTCEEIDKDENGALKKAPHKHFCWMNSVYVFGSKLTEAFAQYGWCTAIRGAEGGGKVTGLPVHNFISDDGDLDMKCPTEVGITDRREAELSKNGFLPLSHYKNTDYAVFFGAQTTQKPKVFKDNDATANAEIAARLPYLMATSRIAHYLKVIARDKIGSFMELNNVEAWLNEWISGYVNTNPESGQVLKSQYPLADAKIQVKEIPGKPGAFQAIAWLRPWMQMEELTTSLRLVAKIPELS